MQTLGKLNLSENANETNPLSDVDLVIKHSESDEVFKISLQLCFDEVEPVNPIGSRASIHKIGCFSGCLKNLPPWFLSDMRMNHLAAPVPYLDIETYGFKEVSTVLRNDLLALENGIQILTRSGKTVFVALRRVDFVADNLAYHAVFGFNKSFSGGLCCGKCVLPQWLLKSVFEERHKDLRNSETCRLNASAKRNGIKLICVLESQFFDPYKNITADLHHDIFQGGLMNILRIVLGELVPDYLSIDCLSSITNIFGFGRDIDGRPLEIDFERLKDKSQGHFEQKYDQMFTLYLFLRLMI